MPYDDAWLAQQLQKPGYRVVGTDTTPPLPTDTPESLFLGRIRQLAKMHGYLVYHTYRSDRSNPGFPDLVLAKPGRLLFIEVKSRTGKLTPAQHIWLDLLAHSVPGVEAHVVRPSDWPLLVSILTRTTP